MSMINRFKFELNNGKHPFSFKVLLPFGLTFTFLLITACSLKVDNKGLSHQVWIPWPTQGGQFQVQKVQVDTITQWSPVRGKAANIRSHYQEIGNNQVSASEVVLDYTKDSSGAVIPMTQFSTELASIYANFERLQKLDQQLGLIDSTEPRNVFVKLNVELDEGEILTNNAFYNFLTDAFYIVPYTESKLPLSVNGAVLAHEHFHSVFGRLIQSPLYAYGKSKNINLFEDYTNHDTSLFKKEFQTLFSSPSGNAVNNVINQNGLPSAANNENQNYRQKLLSDSEVFATFHLNKIYMMALNEGLADVWAWLYSGQTCFVSNSLDLAAAESLPADLWWALDDNYFSKEASRRNVNISKGDDHDNRCLNTKETKLERKSKLTLLNKTAFNSYYGKMKNSYSDELFSIEKKVVGVMGYRLGTNLARLVYRRIEERGELDNPDVRIQWAKHIVNSLPLLLPKFKEVYIDELKIKSLFSWNDAVDLLIFGDGSPEVPKIKCQDWQSILAGEIDSENFKKKCGVNSFEVEKK